ncbi:MAG: glycogen synthase GlgA [Anaerovoracaceae bacterium]
MKVLFVSSEASPFAKSGGLGDVIGSLPIELVKQDAEAAVILPLYRAIKEVYQSELEFINSFDVPLAWRHQYCGLFKMKHRGVIHYFIDNEQYFLRDDLYGYFDDGERFAFFSRAVLESLKHMDFEPRILHCNDWQTGLVPVFLKTLYREDPAYSHLSTVFTIHNIEYQGRFGPEMMDDIIGIPLMDRGIVEMDGDINYMKGAIVTCDKLTTVSPTYEEELSYPYYGLNLFDIIRQNNYKMKGILNGIDMERYNPSKDKNLAANYSVRKMEGKATNKTALREQLGLYDEPDVPIIAMVGRLVEHKGVALVSRVLDEMMTQPMQFVLLGTGDRKYETFFLEKAKSYPGRMVAVTNFYEELASRIYAGADMILMPSLSEPCGLVQLIALRYGTIPIVRETGGLKDTVHPFNPETCKGNGLTFASVNAHDMLYAVRRGQELYKDKELWNKLMKNALRSNYSWKKSVKEYKKIYAQLMEA